MGYAILCGITGKFNFDGTAVDRTLIHKMCDAIIYRGPDAEGIYTAPYIGLGQRRLSIIDLNSAATAPLANEDNSIWVVFNGEIYNFAELRSSLTAHGHTFRTGTDTEVIVHLYEQYGTNCVDHMIGMFAFAIWDSKQKVLFAARDRFGKKPFYYTRTPRSFIFGSEIKALTADPEVRTSPNFAAIAAYLDRQYVPSPLTSFSNIFKLPAAHCLFCGVDGEIKIRRYWSPPAAEKISASEQEIAEELLRLLRESVRLRLVSDVPLGALLSGGVDSGAIVALMALESSKPVKTFSIGFGKNDSSELPYARQVAERYDTEHQEFNVEPSAMEVLPKLVRHFNEPFADPSAIPTYYVSEVARRHVTVALSGDGGDESFGGYSHYEQVLRWQRLDFLPWQLRKLIFGTLSNSLDNMPYSNLTARASRAFHMLASQLPGRYWTQTSVVKSQERHACFTPYFQDLVDSSGGPWIPMDFPWNESMDSLDWMMRHDQTFYLPDCLMVKADIASMANGLELRAPLLDHRLAAFASSIPSQLKRNSSGGKLILKNAVRELLPPDILNKRKTGFRPPIAKWFRHDLTDMLNATLLGDTSIRRGFFVPAFLKRMINEHVSGKRDWSTRLWSYLFLEMWFQEFID
ncbi:MAG: asparagine synthase (glutamine-hydrolyzing) [Acidiferrobacterales bacterium]